MTSNFKAPVLFISHGAPTFAIEPGVLGPRLQALGEQLANPGCQGDDERATGNGS